ncbi:MAG: SDR family NAD(P)-dependent oxidoreductase [Coxiellaceae bacterium]|nr:SDR family NAD(P)-dependent oxidoreductase [Coxiellaceae bacterium]
MPDQYYVVTGASSGIGYALCRHLAKNDKQIIAVARNERRLRELQNANPKNIHTCAADLATQKGRDQAVEFIESKGGVLGLVNCAGTIDPISLLKNLNIDAWHQQLAINIDAPIFLTNALLSSLVKGCRIINLTTGTTKFALSGIAGYAMTKAALNVYTKYLSDELHDLGIFVTAAHPGIVETNLNTIDAATQEAEPDLNIFKIQNQMAEDNKYLDVNLSAKFLCWLLSEADNEIYTGDIIGVYNKKYQPLWHDSEIPSPYPEGVEPP